MTISPSRIVSTIGSVNSGWCALFVLSTWESVHLGGCLLGISSLGSLATWQSARVGCVHYWFGQLCFLLTFGSVFLEVCPTGCLSTWILSILGVWPHDILPSRVVSIISSLNSRFCSRLAYSTWDSIYLGVCLLGVCPLESLATWHSAHVGVCPLMVLPTLDSAQIWFCLLGIMFMKEYFYLRSCTLGILFTCVFDYLDSVHLGVCPHDSQSTKLSAWDTVFQISSGSPLVLSLFESVQLGVYRPGFCTLWSLATWHSFQVGLCPLLVLSTLDCAHFWFCLLGSQSIWVVVYLESVHLGVWPHDILAT